MKKNLVCFFFIFTSILVSGKTDSLRLANSIDSLQSLIKISKIDSNTLQLYFALSDFQRLAKDYDVAIQSAITVEQLSIKTENNKMLCRTYNNLTRLYRLSGKMESLTKLLVKAIEHYKNVNDSAYIAFNYMDFARHHIYSFGNDTIGLQYFDSAIAILTVLDDKVSLGEIYNSIAGVHYNSLRYSKATEVLQKALKVWASDTSRYARVSETTILSNLGILYGVSGDSIKAYESFLQALKIDSVYENYSSISYRLSLLAQMDMQRGDYKTAHLRLTRAIYHMDNDMEFRNAYEIYNHMADLFLLLYKQRKASAPNINDEVTLNLANQAADSIQHYYTKSFKISQQKGQVLQQARTLHRLAEYYSNAEKYKDAADLIEQSIALYDSSNALTENYHVFKDKADVDASLRKFEPAYFNLKKYIQIDDSIMSQDQRIEFAKKTTEFEYVKKMLILTQEKEIQEQREEKQQMIIWFGGAGMGLLLLFILFGYNRYKKTQKQNRIIGIQREELFDKNTKIMSSINYAQRIQYSLLPEEIHLIFNEIFIHYHPRDIVSGDFFWAHESPKYKFLVVADCTGHGIPGAFMSILGISLLDKIVGQMQFLEPKDILTQLSKDVSRRLQKEGDFMSSDGMDIGLIRIDKQTSEITFAGAGSKMCSIENDVATNYSGDILPIGFQKENFSYVNQTIATNSNAMLYLYTDGFSDQPGDDDGVKMGSKRFEKLIIENAILPLPDKEDHLKAAFDNWRGAKRQIDDKCIVGVNIKC